MEYINRRMRCLRKMHRRAVRFWREGCPSVRRRKCLTRKVLFLLTVDTVARAKTGRGMMSWVQEQIPYMEQIEGSSPIRTADQDGMTSVERGFAIRLDEKKIHIFQVEEGYEDREAATDSGSD